MNSLVYILEGETDALTGNPPRMSMPDLQGETIELICWREYINSYINTTINVRRGTYYVG